MPDQWTDKFDRVFARQAQTPGSPPEADPWIKRFDQAFGAAKKVVRIGSEVAQQGAFDLVGSTASLLASALSTPKAALIHEGAKLATRAGITDVPDLPPVRFSPTASLEQLRGLGVQHPTLVDIATDFPTASLMNTIGKRALLPAGRALANLELPGGFRTRALPGVKGTLEFFKPGASLPNEYRDAFYRILAQAEGQTDWRAFVRRKALEGGQELSREAQNAITQAIETKTVGSLSDDLQGWAKRIQAENRQMIEDRLNQKLVRGELRGELDYVARILSREGRKQVAKTGEVVGGQPLSPYGEAFDVGPPRLGTSIGKERTQAGLEKTAEEMAGGRDLFLPAVEGTLAKGAQNDRAVMHARIIRRLDRTFGKPVGTGDKSIASLPGIPSGFDAATVKRLQGRALPKELHDVVTKLNQTFQPQEWGKTSEFVRQMNDQFRKWALFSPGFISRNMQNNVIQTAIFGNRDPRNWVWAQQLREKVRTGARLTADETAELKTMIENGVLSRGYIARESGAGSKFDPKVFQGFRRANTYAEDVSRMAFWKYVRGQGLKPYDAGNRVNQVLFNYSPTYQSRGFRALRQHVMPFINWQANIPQLAVRTALERPGSLAMVGSIRAKLNEANATPEAYKKLPGYMKEEMATAIASDTWLMPQGFGTSDIGGLAGAVAGDVRGVGGVAKNVIEGGRTKLPEYGSLLKQNSRIAGQLASMSYPQYSLLYTALTGNDPFTGNQVTDWRQYLKGKAPITRIPNMIYEIQTKKPGWQYRLLSLVGGIKLYAKPTGK